MPEPPARTALVYGISRYETDTAANVRPNLQLTDDDARSVGAMLASKGWTVTTRIADSIDPDVNALASKTQLRADIAALQPTEDLVLFYYSGHGFSFEQSDGAFVSYICPYGSIDSGSLLLSAMVSVAELESWFEDAGLTNVVIILDSCYSGGFVRDGATADAVPAVYGVKDEGGDIKYTWFIDALGDAALAYVSYRSGSGVVAISAAGSEEYSWESSAYGHGIFTYALLAAADDPRSDLDGDGYVTTTELYAYTTASVDALWNVSAKNSYDSSIGQYSDYLPHLSGTAREYALWATPD
jgi:uncharacterized caspase-like protein